MTQLKIISSMATKHLMVDLAPLYAQVDAAASLDVEAIGGVAAAKRVRDDEAFDIVVLAADVIDKLVEDGKIVRGSKVDLVHSGVYVAVKAGAPKVDVGTTDALKRALLAAASIGYSTGPSGVYLARLFEQWGILDQIKDRLVQAPPGVSVGSFVAEGKVELGFQQLSEMMHLQGIDILGPLPDDIQIMTTFSAGIASASKQPEAARAALAFMASDQAAQAKRDNGMEPA